MLETLGEVVASSDNVTSVVDSSGVRQRINATSEGHSVSMVVLELMDEHSNVASAQGNTHLDVSPV